MDLEYIALWAEEHATNVAISSPDHGPNHWRAVAQIGLEIVAEEPTIDLTSVFLFAALHDTQRENEYHDPAHGQRAADLAKQMWEEQIIDHTAMPKDKMYPLFAAMIGHDRGGIHANPVIAACWDADRLTLGRVGIDPSLDFFSTAVVRADFDGWKEKAEQIMQGYMAWGEIVREYERTRREISTRSISA